MIRFAWTVTAVEVVLTFAAVLLISVVEAPEPYLTRGDLHTLGLRCNAHKTERRAPLHARVTWESQAVLSDPEQNVAVSYRQDVSPADFDLRLRKERDRLEKAGIGHGALIDEPFPGERGYALRFQSENSVRFEQVRAKGDDLLIVRVTHEGVSGLGGRIAMAQCDKRARLVQQVMLDKLRWRY